MLKRIKCLFGKHQDKHVVAIIDNGKKVIHQCDICNKIQIYDVITKECTRWIKYKPRRKDPNL